jgi:virginiamycin B lyase
MWFTENSAGKIGRVDAHTNAITEFVLPGVKDPHTPAMGPDGTLWLTASNGNSVTHLDPKSGEIKTFPLPTSGASPSTILLGPDGAMWFCESATNKLGRLDPATGAIMEFAIPDEQARPRRIAIAGQAIYFAENSGHLGRFTIDKKTFQSWPSPSGAASQPYGITADQTGKIWYYEAGANQLVRFDPANEKFDLFPMLSQKSNVMAMTRDAQGASGWRWEELTKSR